MVVNETNTTVTFATGDIALGLALIFCIFLFAVGMKDKTFWLMAGPAWMISGLTVFLDYGEWMMLMTVGIGLALFLMGAYHVYK